MSSGLPTPAELSLSPEAIRKRAERQAKKAAKSAAAFEKQKPQVDGSNSEIVTIALAKFDKGRREWESLPGTEEIKGSRWKIVTWNVSAN
jgi:hypothetical protein